MKLPWRSQASNPPWRRKEHTSMTEAHTAVIVGLVGLYLLPTIVAVIRHKPSAPLTVVMNVLFGWTIIGWMLSLLWALTVNGTTRHD